MAHYTAYGIQYPAYSKKVFKKISFKKEKCVERVLKKYGKSGETEVRKIC